LSTAPNTSDIQYALSLLLKERFFRTAPKSSAFLTYVVDQTISGNGSRLKAYTIAVEALGKTHEFEPQNDPAIRVMAYRIRNVLDDYNLKPNDATVRMTLKTGSYIPVFTSKQADVMCDRLLQA
jgi:hypothetical protein